MIGPNGHEIADNSILLILFVRYLKFLAVWLPHLFTVATICATINTDVARRVLNGLFCSQDGLVHRLCKMTKMYWK